jgi:hypothetical protein
MTDEETIPDFQEHLFTCSYCAKETIVRIADAILAQVNDGPMPLAVPFFRIPIPSSTPRSISKNSFPGAGIAAKPHLPSPVSEGPHEQFRFACSRALCNLHHAGNLFNFEQIGICDGCRLSSKSTVGIVLLLKTVNPSGAVWQRLRHLFSL